MSAKIKHKFITTEKSTLMREHGKIVVVTNADVMKNELVKFLEDTYEVKVQSVNAMKVKGKKKVRKRQYVTLSDKKKFYVKIDNLDKMDQKVENA